MVSAGLGDASTTTLAPSSGMTTGEIVGVGLLVVSAIGVAIAAVGTHHTIKNSLAMREMLAARSNPARRSSMQVQTLLFPRDRFSTRSARSWTAGHGFSSGKVDVTDRYIRLRQQAPGRFRVMRTIPFGRSGILAVVGRG